MVRRLLLLPVLTALTLGLAAAPASAQAPVPIAGTFTAGPPVPTSAQTVGPVTIFEYTSTVSVTGHHQATGTVTARCVQVEDLFWVCQGEQVLTGALLGVQGTLTNQLVFVCDLTTLRCEGQSVTVSGTGGLSGARTFSTFQGSLVPGSVGTYQGQAVGVG